MQAIHLATSVVAGLALIGLRKPVARWLHPGEDTPDVDARPLLAAGIAIVACYFAVAGLITLGAHYAQTGRIMAPSYAWWQGAFSVAGGLLLFAFAADRPLVGPARRAERVACVTSSEGCGWTTDLASAGVTERVLFYP